MYPRCILVSVPGIAALPRPRGPRRRCVYRAPSCSDASQSDLRACTPASTPPLSSLSDVSRARPPFLYATAALLLYDPTVTMRHPTLLVAASHQRPPPFRSTYSAFSCPFPKDPASFLQTKIIVVLAIRFPTDSYPRHNLHATELLEGSSTSLVPCPYHHVRQRSRPSTQPPPPPCASALTSCSRHGIECTQTLVHHASRRPDRISGGLCAPLAPTCVGRAHRSPRSNDVVPRRTERLGHWWRCDSPASCS
ncbi:hypothetical protein K438DRAFT_2115022 [Mycena galopus ATCC 62051]|nr:hypothetical protein K438DRAFT_2115022 [Mycena galopus ATCC 62051]